MPDTEIFLTFIVPALNEAENIGGTVHEIEEAAALAALPSFEIVLIDDGSTDRTGAVMTELAATKPFVKHLSNPRPTGLGGAYKTGLRAAIGRHVMLVPGDNVFPASSLKLILEKIGTADILVHYVVNNNIRSPGRRFLSVAFTAMLNFIFSLKLPYYNGLVVHRTDVLNTITIETDSFAYQAEALVKLLRAGRSFDTVGTPLVARQHGGSKALRPKNIVGTLRAIYQLKRRLG